MNMNLGAKQTSGKRPCSPAQALAMKNAALRAVLGYIENKHGPDGWLHDELACRFHRLVELALEAPCDLGSEEQPRFQILDSPFNQQP